MKKSFKGLAALILPVMLLGMMACSGTSERSSGASSTPTAEANTPSGTVAIDETRIMWMVGDDIGGGRLEFQGQSHEFKMGGLKLGGFGVHNVKLDGDVWDLDDIADFPGVYAAAEVCLSD
jgi:hypothetical protein